MIIIVSFALHTGGDTPPPTPSYPLVLSTSQAYNISSITLETCYSSYVRVHNIIIHCTISGSLQMVGLLQQCGKCTQNMLGHTHALPP